METEINEEIKKPLKNYEKFVIGAEFGKLVITGYRWKDGSIRQEREYDPCYYAMTEFYKYRVYCRGCGTTKIMDEVNLAKYTTCGCSKFFISRINFNDWTAKSKRL